MSSDEYKKKISNEVKEFIKKRIQVREIYKELQQIKNNIIYLKKKFRKEVTEEFSTDEAKLTISKYKSEFSSRLKKEFKDLPIEKKKELYKSGLLTILFRLNYSKYEKLKDINVDTPLDEYAIKRESVQPYRWNISLSDKTKNKLKDYEKHLKEQFDLKLSDQEEEVQKQLNELEEDRFKIDAEIEKEQELIKEQLEELGIETDPDETTPDVYDAIMNDLVEIEEEDEDDD